MFNFKSKNEIKKIDASEIMEPTDLMVGISYDDKSGKQNVALGFIVDGKQLNFKVDFAAAEEMGHAIMNVEPMTDEQVDSVIADFTKIETSKVDEVYNAITAVIIDSIVSKETSPAKRDALRRRLTETAEKVRKDKNNRVA